MSAGSDPAADGLVGEDAWLELAVACDPEAVEAVSEILARVAPGGVSVEPGFTLVDEGLGAAVDPQAPATVRAYLPARDAAAVRRATEEVDRALGHLQAFGLREIGELSTQVVHESDWANAWKRHVGVMRVGRRIVIRPTWRRQVGRMTIRRPIRRTPTWRFQAEAQSASWTTCVRSSPISRSPKA